MMRRIGIIVQGIAMFGVTHRLVERVNEISANNSTGGFYPIFLEILLAVSVIFMVGSTAVLALRFRNAYRWIVALVAAVCISLAVVLDLRGRTELWVIAVLYFAPQLALMFVGKPPDALPMAQPER